MCRIIFRFYYAEMRRKFWPKAPAKEGALGQMSRNFQVYFIHINFFKKPKTAKWPKAADSSKLRMRKCDMHKEKFEND